MTILRNFIWHRKQKASSVDKDGNDADAPVDDDDKDEEVSGWRAGLKTQREIFVWPTLKKLF